MSQHEEMGGLMSYGPIPCAFAIGALALLVLFVIVLVPIAILIYFLPKASEEEEEMIANSGNTDTSQVPLPAADILDSEFDGW